ncbi:putative inactive histone-lysine N-methyltransferase SUVR2 [Silene latifolia]|uniref:putative inactive histone-lysine N-methyltransferase SUVR2 n=1 Tax=Silene latifolia TaxID=37657 RepID=UPI003D76E651
MKNPKIEKAFDAMKALGISRDKVKPVLKHLYKLYDKNWSFIEAEDYRALVDAIFEEDKETETKRKMPVNSDLSEPPFKKPYRKSEEDETSSTIDSSGMRVVLKEGDIASISFPGGIPETSGLRPVKVENVETELGSCSAIHKGKGKLLSDTMSNSVKIMSERASSSSGFKSLANGSGSVPVDLENLPGYHRPEKLSMLDSEGDTDCIPMSGTSAKISALPDLVEASSSGNISAKLSQCVDLVNVKECGSASNFQKNECRLDIVSSRSGDVKLCCISTLGKSTSNMVDNCTDGVLKSVEENFLRTYKVLGPPFSFKNLLEDLVNSFSESNVDSANKSLIRVASPEVIIQELEHLEVQDEKKSENTSQVVLIEGKKRQPRLFVADIAKGEETVKISLVDDHGNRQPPKFFYIPKNIIYQKAMVNISLARISDEDCCSSCSGDCLSSSVPCACTRTTNGEFAYTNDGLLKSEFLTTCLVDNRREFYCQDCPMERAKNHKKPEKCKGHAVRKFIKECWSKCGCNMQCGNRVVQRGISRKLQVFWTASGKGWGLRTMEDLPKGAFVCEYVGEVVTNTELDERNRKSNGNDKHTYPVHLDADWNSESILDDDFALCLDATNYGNVARFINHKCGNSNLLDIPVEVETVDHHYYHVAFFTTREVKAYEELSWDYGIDFDDEHHPVKAFRCRCGSTLCRDKSRKGSRSRPRASAR